jgi:hypothetical protein
MGCLDCARLSQQGRAGFQVRCCMGDFLADAEAKALLSAKLKR